MATPEQTKRVVAVYAAQQASLIEALLRALLGMWLPFGGWRSPAMVDAHAAGSAVQIDAALSVARRLARVYAEAMLEQAGVTPRGLPPLRDTYERGGAPIVEVYKRPAKQFIHALSQGATVEEATAVAEQRLSDLVESDVMATMRDEVNKVYAAMPQVIGTRRVIHPEKSKSGSCGLCVVAASQFYAATDLMPLHDGCHCTEAPITKDADPGLRLNREDLDEIYRAAGSSLMEDLKKIRVEVREHGELGPILARAGDNFRDYRAVNRDAKQKTYTPYKRMTPIDQMKMWDAMKQSSERSLEKLRAARDRGSASVDLAGTGKPVEVKDIAQAIQYHLDLIARANSYLL